MFLLLLLLPTDLLTEHPNNELPASPPIQAFHWLPTTHEPSPVPTRDSKAPLDLFLPCPLLTLPFLPRSLSHSAPAKWLLCCSSNSLARTPLVAHCLQGSLACCAFQQLFSKSLVQGHLPDCPWSKAATPNPLCPPT